MVYTRSSHINQCEHKWVHSQGADEMRKKEKKKVIISHLVVDSANAANVSSVFYRNGQKMMLPLSASDDEHEPERSKWPREQIYDKECGGSQTQARDKNCIRPKMKL